MNINEILAWGGGGLLLLLSMVQISPLKLDPWSAIGKALGRALNAEVLKELEEVRATQRETKARLDAHINTDDERYADGYRAKILQFNAELIRNIPHTREDFIEVLSDIDKYEHYCKEHPDYPNGRAVHAIANIGRVYDERLIKKDFLQV